MTLTLFKSVRCSKDCIDNGLIAETALTVSKHNNY